MPTTTRRMKYRLAHVLTSRIPSYITTFQFSPVNTWKMVTKDQKISSKLCLALWPRPSRARYSALTCSVVRVLGLNLSPEYIWHSPPAPLSSNVTHWPTREASHGA